MESIKKLGTTLKSNPVGAVIGAVALVVVAKKYGHAAMHKPWVLVVAGIVGAVVGSGIQSKIKAKASAPAAIDIKK